MLAEFKAKHLAGSIDGGRSPALARAATFWGSLDIALAILGKTVLTLVWLVAVFVLKGVALLAIDKLPRRIRMHAAREVDWILRITECGGILSYAIWTTNEVLVLGRQLLLHF